MSLATHSAPSTAAAFDYQFERALLWLAKSKSGAIVGVETADDVAVREENGILWLEQAKHSVLPDGETFGDRRKDLWNTLATWIEAIDSGEIDLKLTRFLMVTNKTLPDCIAIRIGKANLDPDIDACIKDMEIVAAAPPESIRSLVERVMAATSRVNLRGLLRHTFCADATFETSGEALRQQTIAHLPFPEWCMPAADSVVNELLGWVHSVVLRHWQSQKPGWISRNQFINQFHAILDLRKRKITRERSANLINIDEDKVSKEKGSAFVKQLFLVTDDAAEVDGAIRDLIRCNIEKARLATEGNITDEDWLSFESSLLSRWEKIWARILRMNRSLAEKDQGYLIYTDTTEDYRENLAGTPTEQVYLTAGTYHRMANQVHIGWHPRYKEIMEVTPV